MRHEYLQRKGGIPSTMAGVESSPRVKVNVLEILHPGYAYTWTDDATGLKVVTNLSSSDCNRRDPAEGIVYFRSDKALWSWAKRVRTAAARGLTP
jgi:hypothetical protein